MKATCPTCGRKMRAQRICALPSCDVALGRADAVYCSHAHKIEGQRKPQEKCKLPGCPHMAPRRNKAGYCSIRCGAISRAGRRYAGRETPAKTCRQCGGIFKKPANLDYTRWDKKEFCPPCGRYGAAKKRKSPKVAPPPPAPLVVEPLAPTPPPETVVKSPSKPAPLPVPASPEPPPVQIMRPPPLAVPERLAIDEVDVEALGSPRTAAELLPRWHKELRAWCANAGLTAQDLRRSGDWPTMEDAERALPSFA